MSSSSNSLETLKKQDLTRLTSETNLIKNKLENVTEKEKEIEQEQRVTNNYNRKVTKNKIELHSGSCCCCRCFGLFSLCFQVLNCFSGWCLRPCCSTAAVLGGIGALGGVLAGVMLMGVFGIIPIPMEFTRNICNATHERNNYYYQNNFTIIKEIDTNSSFDKSWIKLFMFSNKLTKKIKQNFFFFKESFLNTTHLLFENKTILDINNRNINSLRDDESRLNRNSVSLAIIKKNLTLKLRNYLKYKNKISKFIPLKYDVLLMPTLSSNDFLMNDESKTSLNNVLDMKIDLNVRLYCNFSTNLILFNTREFSNIDLRFFKI